MAGEKRIFLRNVTYDSSRVFYGLEKVINQQILSIFNTHFFETLSLQYLFARALDVITLIKLRLQNKI
jgi:hypothetical protein